MQFILGLIKTCLLVFGLLSLMCAVSEDSAKMVYAKGFLGIILVVLAVIMMFSPYWEVFV